MCSLVDLWGKMSGRSSLQLTQCFGEPPSGSAIADGECGGGLGIRAAGSRSSLGAWTTQTTNTNTRLVSMGYVKNQKPKIDVADTLSAVQFDDTGEYLATGDKGGRSKCENPGWVFGGSNLLTRGARL